MRTDMPAVFTKTMLLILCCAGITRAATLDASDTAMRPGSASHVIVTGRIENEPTFGVTIMIELAPRAGARGALAFTGPDTPPLLEHVSFTNVAHSGIRPGQVGPMTGVEDVQKLSDVWPAAGTFTVFDTNRTGSTMLNGLVEDNGTYVPSPVTFDGDLAAFPVRASRDALGVWDVLLVTSAGASGWEGVPTTLVAGTIIVTPQACWMDSQCDDTNDCTQDSCATGICRNVRQGDCDDPDSPDAPGEESKPQRLDRAERQSKP